MTDLQQAERVGLYGSNVGANMFAAAVAETVGTFILIYGAVPAATVGTGQALLVEALVTFILVFVVVSVATDDRVPTSLAPIAVGAALAIRVFIAGPVTGGAVNPVRALGPALVAGRFTDLWIYIVGPVVGGILAALVYDRFLAKAEAPL